MLYIHNPHTKNFFWQTVMDFLLRNNISKKSQKYRYLLEYLSREKIRFGVYVDYNETSLPPYFKSRLLIRCEVLFWLLLKGLNPRHVRIIDSIDRIHDEDTFFSFSLSTLDTEYAWRESIADRKFYKMFHFSHFVWNAPLVSKNYWLLNGDWIIAEADLSWSAYFRKHFPFYGKSVYVLPFTFGKKFVNTVRFSEREDLCLSVWAIVFTKDYPLLFDDFKAFYHSETLQPLRKEILDRQSEISDRIVTTSARIRMEESSGSRIWQILNKILYGQKHSYFVFDIVQRFNQHKMFVCGEELGDLPGIGFVEGMACGCAYIGKESAMYRDIGMVAGKHYIGHDGTVEWILKVVDWGRAHPEELEKIALEWCRFVRENLSGNAVAEKFFRDISRLENERLKRHDKEGVAFTCSFSPACE